MRSASGDETRDLFGIEVADLDSILERAATAWEKLAGARIFISGGTGFFGKWLVGAILWANRRHSAKISLVVLSRDSQRFIETYPEAADEPALTFVDGEIASFDFPTGTFSHIIHAATETNLAAHRNYLTHLTAIVGGTQRIGEFAKRSGAQDLLITSSGAVYGEQPANLDRIPEVYGGAPDSCDLGNVYGSAKRLAETMCVAAATAGAFRAKIARCFAFIGPHLPLDGHFAIGNFLRDALVGQPIRISGDGCVVRSYLYAGDLIVWLLMILTEGQHARPYNVGSDHALSIKKLAETVLDSLSSQSLIELQNSPASSVSRLRYVPDIDRARNELRLDVWTSLPEALRKTASWSNASRK